MNTLCKQVEWSFIVHTFMEKQWALQMSMWIVNGKQKCFSQFLANKQTVFQLFGNFGSSKKTKHFEVLAIIGRLWPDEPFLHPISLQCSKKMYHKIFIKNPKF